MNSTVSKAKILHQPTSPPLSGYPTNFIVTFMDENQFAETRRI